MNRREFVEATMIAPLLPAIVNSEVTANKAYGVQFFLDGLQDLADSGRSVDFIMISESNTHVFLDFFEKRKLVGGGSARYDYVDKEALYIALQKFGVDVVLQRNSQNLKPFCNVRYRWEDFGRERLHKVENNRRLG